MLDLVSMKASRGGKVWFGRIVDLHRRRAVEKAVVDLALEGNAAAQAKDRHRSAQMVCYGQGVFAWLGFDPRLLFMLASNCRCKRRIFQIDNPSDEASCGGQ